MNHYVYVHIPFCLSKCHYCSFISFAGAQRFESEYFEALKKEIELFFGTNSEEKLKTLYMGGGTPSIVPVENYEQILSALPGFDEGYEFTFEVNPKTVDKNYLLRLKQLGVNRLSIGVQSFDDEILKMINRQHSKNDAIKCFNDARDAGFDNVSIDLIYGLPRQNLEILNHTLDSAIDLNPEHISIYGLKIEEGSKFYESMPDFLPDDDECADMYLEIVDRLDEAGFLQYEISNFAKKGKHSIHNLNYWNNNDYTGFGLAAHGYFKGIRYSHALSLSDYIKNPSAQNQIEISRDEKIEDEIILGLRRVQGIDIKDFQQKYGIDFKKTYKSILEKYSQFFVCKNDHISLNKEGFLVSNIILAEFLK